MNSISRHSLEELINQFKEILAPENLIVDIESQKPYECDGLSLYCEIPMVTVLPESVDEVCKITAICHKYDIPLVARGSGTGLCAGAMPNKSGVLMSLAKLTGIIEINTSARTVTVETGVTNLAISEAVTEYGFYYAPDPSSQIACSIGGNVAENAGGVHCLKYGLTVHNILSVKMVTVEGELLTLGSAALDSAGLDMMAIITGSEGLLGIVVEVTVKILPIPEVARVIMAGFSSVQEAGDAVGAIIAAGIIPAGLEMMDRLAIRTAEDFVHAGYPTDAKALLLCEVDGTVEEVDEHIQQVQQRFVKLGATTVRISKDEAERALFWKGRKSAFPAIGRISTDYYCMDGTIPRSKISQVLEEIDKLSEQFGLKVANVFHAGDGNLHPMILFDASIDGELASAEEFGGKILQLCVDVGGCITGEHGVGIEKLRQMPDQFTDAELQQFHQIKAAFDSNGNLNPGKGIPSLKQCQEYRSINGNKR
ncbi:MAG: FAD-binding protein [Gammaproteobacteria bacterium]|nr:FAD-binding protein [Gammaproteobacteria bacterium]